VGERAVDSLQLTVESEEKKDSSGSWSTVLALDSWPAGNGAMGGTPPPSKCMSFKTKELREEHFVSARNERRCLTVNGRHGERKGAAPLYPLGICKDFKGKEL
jgi:hypothetical protein